ncbi:MAG: hypothetical protein A2054_03965 [Deltaproteobacteria bacterium GWA2_55_10]|nr:MAG: hypothetical protein A2054_03965 [Deltaproteobacteria bacterium GWA2_55_10]
MLLPSGMANADECLPGDAACISHGGIPPEALEALKSDPELLKLNEAKAKKETAGKIEKAAPDKAGEKREEKALKESAPKTLFERYVAEPGAQEISLKLAPFGYDLFSEAAPAASQDLPVASDYVVGPGDEIDLLLWGRVNGRYNLTVGREGAIQFPYAGPLTVGGMTFSDMRKYLMSQSNKIIGTEMSVTMGRLRGIQVFVLGEVKRPGAYNVSAMSTATAALMASGGPTEIGSLRMIEVKRTNGAASKLDFYDLLLRGDRSKDQRLQNGDVIFVPVVGPLVAIAGNVKRPAVYELAGPASLDKALEIAGGVMPVAYTQQVQVTRIEGNDRKIVVDLNARDEKARSFELRDGDLIKVFPISAEEKNAVYLEGNVKRPGKYELKRGMRLKDLIQDESGLLKDTYMNYGFVKRKASPGRNETIERFSVEGLFSGSDADNPDLMPGDTVHVFSKWSFRQRPLVHIQGEVRCSEIALEKTEPGRQGRETQSKGKDNERKKDEKNEDDLSGSGSDGHEKGNDEKGKQERKACSFELVEKMTVKDILFMAGGLTAEASYGDFEIYRTDPATREIKLLRPDLSKAIEGVPPIFLQQDDRLIIHSIREVQPRQFVTISGDVNKPGQYQLAQGMTVKDLLFTAGNLLESAHIAEAELTSGAPDENGIFSTSGRKIDLSRALAGDPAHDIALKAYDSLFIKRILGWMDEKYVTLSGEVAFPGKYRLKKDEKLSMVLERAGGFTEKAYLKGAVFTRPSVRALQQKKLEESIDKLEKEMLSKSAMKMEGALTPEEAKQYGLSAEQSKALMEKMRSVRATGRISIRLESVERLKGSQYDIELEDGDVLIVPHRPAQVQVMGSVYNQAAFIYDDSFPISRYIELAGGMDKNAADDEVYILKADGTAVSKKSINRSWLRWDRENKGWASGVGSYVLDPGDTIVVPEKLEKTAWLKEFKDITQILYQIAVTAGVIIVAF